MKVGILTLRFHSNFGFLMQSYALQKIVKEYGHEPFHFYIKEEPLNAYEKVIGFFKKIARNTISGTHYPLFTYSPTEEDMKYKDRNTWDFINKHLTLTPYIPSLTTKNAHKIPAYDAYIVGSDQVWRREFTDDILCYYFNFTPDNAKRMAYAASFGKDTLSYSSKAIDECKRLLTRFDAVTVREDDGVRICKEYFDCNATKVLDPTLLLSQNDYIELIEDPEIPFSEEPYIFTYILRPNKEKLDFIKRFSDDRGMKVINIMPEVLEKVGKRRIDECVYPSISTWLKGFSQANYILTDSFHASVFSIIFNKIFYVINDSTGGITRIPSLLNTFGLTNRYARDYDGTVQIINYDEVNQTRYKRIKDSKVFFDSFFNE